MSLSLRGSHSDPESDFQTSLTPNTSDTFVAVERPQRNPGRSFRDAWHFAQPTRRTNP